MYQASCLSLYNQWHRLIVESPWRKEKTAVTVAHYKDSLLHFEQSVTVELLTVFIWFGCSTVLFQASYVLFCNLV